MIHHRSWQRHNPRIALLLSITALIAVLLTACGGSKTADSGTSGAPFDQQFVDMMVPHHQSATEMAKLAQTRAEHPELKTLAGNIIADQNKEIDQMKTWRKAWFGSDQTPAMEQMPLLPGMSMGNTAGMNGNGTMNMMKDIEGLKTAQPFDKAFMQAMMQHHTQAIDAAKIAQEKGTRPEIKTLAGSIITSQQKEITQMQGWLKAWYG